MMPPSSTALPSSNAVLLQSRPTSAPLAASLASKGTLLSITTASPGFYALEGIALPGLVSRSVFAPRF